MIDFGVLYLQSKYINFRMVVEFLTRVGGGVYWTDRTWQTDLFRCLTWWIESSW